MAQPVWTLSVDLQTKTATFTSGLADAAKGARSSFEDIKADANNMGREVGGSMTEARHGVMLLGEEFGVHLPRSLTTFIASLGPVGAAMEAAFPFLAILVGATLLLEHLSKLKAEGEKLTESQVNFGTTVQNVFNSLDDKLLQAGIRADELNHDHLGALNKQLQLIDHATFNELAHAFDTISKAADVTFADLKASFTASFFDISKGSEGAKHALSQFKAEYDSLLAQHKDKEATDLLAGTLESAKKSYELMQAQQGGHGSDEKELASQAKLVEVLEDQIKARAKLNQLKDADVARAKQETGGKISRDADSAAKAEFANAEKYDSLIAKAHKQLTEELEKQSAEESKIVDARLKAQVSSEMKAAEEIDKARKLAAEAGHEDDRHDNKMAELQMAADREAGKVRIAQERMTTDQLADMEMSFAAREFAAKQKANQAELATLDQHAADYANKVKALQNRQIEQERAFENQITQIKVQAEIERDSRISAARRRMDDDLARGLSRTLMGQQSFAKMMVTLGDQVIGSMMEVAIKSILAHDMTKESDAAAAARKAYNAMASIPYVGPALGAAAAAGAFTMLMGFEEGGIVPGVGTGDIVPAKLEPGEGVLTKKVMEGMSYRAKFGGDDKTSGDVHIHHHATYHVQALDGTGVDRVLQNHGDKFTEHAARTLRKMNRG
jgi:hypothetical protein